MLNSNKSTKEMIRSVNNFLRNTVHSKASSIRTLITERPLIRTLCSPDFQALISCEPARSRFD